MVILVLMHLWAQISSCPSLQNSINCLRISLLCVFYFWHFLLCCRPFTRQCCSEELRCSVSMSNLNWDLDWSVTGDSVKWLNKLNKKTWEKENLTRRTCQNFCTNLQYGFIHKFDGNKTLLTVISSVDVLLLNLIIHRHHTWIEVIFVGWILSSGVNGLYKLDTLHVQSVSVRCRGGLPLVSFHPRINGLWLT